MYNLLIVDDEPYVTEGLKVLFTEEMSGELDVYCANNGFKAMQWLNKIRIDIVLLDIKMPDVSGIELHKIIIDKWPYCKVIFLTAFDNFSYIQSALKKNAVDYILKTDKDEQILNAVQKALNIINDEKKDKNTIDRVNTNIRYLFPLIQQNIFISLLNNSYYENIYELFNNFNIAMEADNPVMILIGKKDNDDKDMQIDEYNHIYIIKEIVEEHLKNNVKITSVINNINELICFIQPGEIQKEQQTTETWNNLYIFITGSLERIQSICSDMYNITISFALSRKPCTWSHVHNKYTQLINAFNFGFGFHKEIIIDELYINDEREIEKADKYYIDKLIRQITDNLEENNINKYTNNIRVIIQYAHSYPTDSMVAMDIFHTVSSKLIAYINYIGIRDQIPDSISIDDLTNIRHFVSWTDIEEYFYKIGKVIIKYKLEKSLEAEKNIVTTVNEYIIKHIDGDTSLATIADNVYFNPFYLSRLYKKFARKSISDYIIETKLQLAKKMLKENKLKINDIAHAVGFSNNSYFTRFFKKHENMNPSEYRDSH